MARRGTDSPTLSGLRQTSLWAFFARPPSSPTKPQDEAELDAGEDMTTRHAKRASGDDEDEGQDVMDEATLSASPKRRRPSSSESAFVPPSSEGVHRSSQDELDEDRHAPPSPSPSQQHPQPLMQAPQADIHDGRDAMRMDDAMMSDDAAIPRDEKGDELVGSSAPSSPPATASTRADLLSSERMESFSTVSDAPSPSSPPSEAPPSDAPRDDASAVSDDASAVSDAIKASERLIAAAALADAHDDEDLPSAFTAAAPSAPPSAAEEDQEDTASTARPIAPEEEEEEEDAPETPAVARSASPALSSSGPSGSEGRASRKRTTPEQRKAQEAAAKRMKEQEAALDRMIKAKQKRKQDLDKLEKLYDELRNVPAEDEMGLEDIQEHMRVFASVTDFVPVLQSIDAFPHWSSRVPFSWDDCSPSPSPPPPLLSQWLSSGMRLGTLCDAARDVADQHWEALFARLLRADPNAPRAVTSSDSDALHGILCGTTYALSPACVAVWPFATPRGAYAPPPSAVPLLAPATIARALVSLGAPLLGERIVAVPRSSSSAGKTALLNDASTSASGSAASLTSLSAAALPSLPCAQLVAAVCLLSSVAVCVVEDDAYGVVPATAAGSALPAPRETAETRERRSVRALLALQLLHMLNDVRFVDARPRLEAHLALLLDADARLVGVTARMLLDALPRDNVWLRDSVLASIPRVRASRRLKRLVASQYVVDLYGALREATGVKSAEDIVGWTSCYSTDKGEEEDKEEERAPLTFSDMLRVARAFRATPPDAPYEYDAATPYETFYVLLGAMLHALPDDVPRRSPATAELFESMAALRDALRIDIHRHIREKSGVNLDRSKVKFAIERIDSHLMALVMPETSGVGQFAIENYFARSKQ